MSDSKSSASSGGFGLGTVLTIVFVVIGCSSPPDPQLDSGTIEQDAQGVKDVNVIDSAADSLSPQDANFLIST